MAERKNIAAIAQGAGLEISPHGPASPVGSIVAAQLASTLPNFKILEYAYGEVPWRADLIDPPEDTSRGHAHVSDRPGWGITLNQRVADQYAL